MIRELSSTIEQRVAQLREEYGVKAKLSELEDILQEGNEILDLAQSFKDPYFNQSEAKYINITKAQLEEFFHHYELVVDIFPILPPHARIGIDLRCYVEKAGIVEVFLLEATLFEDMASLFNTMFEIWSSSNKRQDDNPVMHKRLGALCRATSKAAFSLLEGYLKGLALDILMTQQVSPEEKMKLTEWDEARSRPVMMKLRDKILQYPKIALQLQHPPLTEQNCAEFAEILEAEKLVRHTIVHPSPPLKFETPEMFREELFSMIGPGVARDTCDMVISLIFKISKTMGDKFGKASYWLVPRDKNTERFPDSVFF